MKEAAGELNMTVITVVAIAAIAAFLAIFVWPQLQGNITRSTKCANVLSCGECNGNISECRYQAYDQSGNEVGEVETIECPCNQ